VKLSDYVAQFLADQGICHVFAVTGGASVHLIDSVAKRNDITYVCPQHEQGGAMAADGYARASGGLGAAISTSGPGVTNLITGICSAFYDSVPVLFITGQVSTFRFKDGLGVRQFGFQETDTVPMCKYITKYAVRLEDASRIRFELEKAVHIALSGRPGPVLIDLPDNLQREHIDPAVLKPFGPVKPNPRDGKQVTADTIEKCLAFLEEAERPVFIFGWGVRLAGAAEDARVLAERLGVPVLPSWGMRDLLPEGHPLLIGSFGTHGTYYGNFAVQNADLLISIGCRLDTHETGSPLSTFAREAKKVVVDIDQAELNKFKRFDVELDLAVHADAGTFISALLNRVSDADSFRRDVWLDRIKGWKEQFPICRPEYFNEDLVNPYVFVHFLSSESREGDVFYMDTGCALAWMMQAFSFKPRQRAFHAFNNTPMGCGLPGAIGASLALDGAPVICVTGDGSLQMNIQELATVIRHQLPIKIFMMNNSGYSMIQQTQEQWLDARYEASNIDGGLGFPDFEGVATAYGFKTANLNRNDHVQERIREVLDTPGAVFCNVEIMPEHRVIPQVKYGRPIEDPEPLLDRETFFGAMIVPHMLASET